MNFIHGPIRFFALAGLAGALTTPAFSAPPPLITMDVVSLERAKQRLQAKDPALAPAYGKLLEAADALLSANAETVTAKKIVPPSGDKHDYMSLAPYWWPDPSKPNGLPYIQKDGQFNPSAKNGDTDSVRMQFFCMSSQILSLAFYFTDDPRYAKKAAEFLRVWFLNPETKMNPHLEYGQAVMGRVSGRGIGLIDTRNFWMPIDAALILEAAGQLKPDEMAGLKAWFRDFTAWMIASAKGVEEFKATNNHGTFYDMQVANYALFYGDPDLAKKTVGNALDLRVASQITDDGKQPLELRRATPFHYSAFNLDAMCNLARYGEQVGVNVWNTREKSRGLRNGIDYLLPFAVAPETWPYAELDRPETELALAVLLKAERAYGGGVYAAAAGRLPVTTLEAQEYIALYAGLSLTFPDTKTSVDRLLWLGK